MEPGKETIFTDQQHEVLKSIRLSRIILPILIGVGVVFYLAWKQFNPEEFSKINWSTHTLFWVLMALVFLIIRHLAYATRLYILAGGEFSFSKCIELIFIWEFSSAVSPTAVGGSAVALFVLSQEKLSPARVTSIVLYTVVLDTFFFIGTLLILFTILGPIMIRPGLESIEDLDGWSLTFLLTYLFMALYGFFFFYALFIKPEKAKGILNSVTNIRFLRRYKAKALEVAEDFIVASKDMAKRPYQFHIGAFAATFMAWSMKFLLLNCLIIAIVDTTALNFNTQFTLYARLEAMFVIMAFSPTPGGAGFAEFVFGGFLSDYVPKGISLVVAFMWRILTYYSYLLAGAIIIPNWIRKIIAQRRIKRKKKNSQSQKS